MSDAMEAPNKKRKWYMQAFKEEWLQDQELKDWLIRDRENKEASYCQCSNMTFKNANKSLLLRHKDSLKHMRNEVSEIDPSDEKNHKNIDNVYLGGRAMTYLTNAPFYNNVSAGRLKNDCLKFPVELSIHIRKRFPFSENGLIAKLKILDPKIEHDHKQSPSSIASLAAHFSSLVPEYQLNELDDQWRSFRLLANNLPISAESIPEYWHKLSYIKDGRGNSKYSLLSDFMTNLTVLPHSSAYVERVFSQMNCVKTKITNSLKAETVKDRLMAKQSITRNNMTCTNWEPKKELIRDLEDGTVCRRYLQRLEVQKEKK